MSLVLQSAVFTSR